LAKNHYFEDVYDVVRSIPEGRVSTYGAIADYLTLGSARMVGWALRNLTLPHRDVPAHRVVNRVGELTGRNHFGDPNLMQALLEAEGVEVTEDKVVQFKSLFWHPRD
jgi:methylated-DNA-protein-cysteine methyltransferase-like protein